MTSPLPKRFHSAFFPALFLTVALCWECRAQAPPGGTADRAAANPTQLELEVPQPAMQTVLNSILDATATEAQATTLADGRIQLATASQLVRLEFQPSSNRLRVIGSNGLASSIARLVKGVTEQAIRKDIRVVPLARVGKQTLHDQGVFQNLHLPELMPGKSPTEASFQFPAFRGFRRVQLASAQEQPSPEIGSGSSSLGTGIDTESEDSPLRGMPLQQFDGVQVEMLPDIDAIILRGRDKQLEDLAEIIKRLDEASRVAQPEIEVLLLENVAAQSLGTIIQSTQQSVLASRQGKVTAIPLSSPNAILLIGWGDALKVLKELIGKLDRPVPPDTTFNVIQLKHAAASQIQTQLQGFFQSRGGLGPLIQSTVDNRTNALIVHAAPRDLEQIRQLIQQLDVPRGEVVQQARIFEIRNSLATDIATTLRQAISGTANDANTPLELLDSDGRSLASSGILANSRITVNERNNSIIVSTAAENLTLFAQLIQQLDTPGMVAKIKIFPIINADAGALVETLRSLIPSQTSGTAASPQLSSSPDESSLVPLRFTVDGRGNNIIAVGSEGDLKIVEALIVRLDESDTLQRKSNVYQLKNSPATDIALAINEFLRSKRQVENVTPGSVNPFEQLEREVVVVPEPVQNKLIVSATPRYYEEISRLIEQLDQQPPQVMIQVLIAEVALQNTHEFGMELGIQSSVLFDRSLLGDLLTRSTTTTTSTPAGVVTETVEEIVAASNTPGFNFNNSPLGNSGSAAALANSGRVGGQGLSNFSVGRTNEELGFGGLVLSASSENVSFLLRALQDCRRLEILSRPQVLTLDNQQAFIQVGQRIPRITEANVTQFGFQTGVTIENVGLILGVTPRISPEGNVVMELDAEKSKLRPEDEGIPISVAQDGSVIRSPIVDTITAQATVSAADGETIILGGLINKEERVNHRKVPWLGDIPVLKNFFRYEFNQTLRTELLIILTPHIVRTEADMQRLKQAEFARMSWCEADVFDMHGDINYFNGPVGQSFESGDWEVVYPDVDPRGRLTDPAREAVPLRDLPDQWTPQQLPPGSYESEPAMIEANPISQPGNATAPLQLPLTAQESSGTAKAGGAIPANYSESAVGRKGRYVVGAATQKPPPSAVPASMNRTAESTTLDQSGLSGLGLPSVSETLP